MDHLQIGRNIKAERTRKGMTQTQVGNACGWNLWKQGRLERTGRISAIDLVRVADALGITPCDMLPEGMDLEPVSIFQKPPPRPGRRLDLTA